MKFFDTKIFPFNKSKIFNVTELPESIIRYKFQDINNNSRISSLFSNQENFKVINNESINNSPMKLNTLKDNNNNEVNPLLVSLDQKFKNMENFDSNFLSNLNVRDLFIN